MSDDDSYWGGGNLEICGSSSSSWSQADWGVVRTPSPSSSLEGEWACIDVGSAQNSSSSHGSACADGSWGNFDASSSSSSSSSGGKWDFGASSSSPAGELEPDNPQKGDETERARHVQILEQLLKPRVWGARGDSVGDDDDGDALVRVPDARAVPRVCTQAIPEQLSQVVAAVRDECAASLAFADRFLTVFPSAGSEWSKVNAAGTAAAATTTAALARQRDLVEASIKTIRPDQGMLSRLVQVARRTVALLRDTAVALRSDAEALGRRLDALAEERARKRAAVAAALDVRTPMALDARGGNDDKDDDAYYGQAGRRASGASASASVDATSDRHMRLPPERSRFGVLVGALLQTLRAEAAESSRALEAVLAELEAPGAIRVDKPSAMGSALGQSTASGGAAAAYWAVADEDGMIRYPPQRAPQSRRESSFATHKRLLAATCARTFPKFSAALARAEAEFVSEYAPAAPLRDAHVASCRASVAYRDAFLPEYFTLAQRPHRE